jgi:LuxR family transcriptional regulator, positive regulator of biofilm formation
MDGQYLLLVGFPQKLQIEFETIAPLVSLSVRLCNQSSFIQARDSLISPGTKALLVAHYIRDPQANAAQLKSTIASAAFHNELHWALCQNLNTELEVLLLANGFRAGLDVATPVIEKIQTLETLMAGEIGFSASAMSSFILNNKVIPSTHRVDVMTITTQKEQQIVSLIWQGFTNEEVAHSLSISINTVKMHVQNIYKKAKIKNRGQLHALAHQHH